MLENQQSQHFADLRFALHETARIPFQQKEYGTVEQIVGSEENAFE